MSAQQDEPVTRMRAQDVIVWQEGDESCQVFHWPIFAGYWHSASPDLAWFLLNGWSVVSRQEVRRGFLWLDLKVIWTFTLPVEWDRKGTAESYVGSRLTPSYPYPRMDS